MFQELVLTAQLCQNQNPFSEAAVTCLILWAFNPDQALRGRCFTSEWSWIVAVNLTLVCVPPAVSPMGGGATRLYGSVTFGGAPNLDPDFCQVSFSSHTCRLVAARELRVSVCLSVCPSRSRPTRWSCCGGVKRPWEEDLLASTGTLHPSVMEKTRPAAVV